MPLWVSTQTRSDVANATCFASNAVTRGTIADLKMVNKTFKFLEKNSLTLRFKKLLLTESVFVVFCDTSFGNLKDGSSQGGFYYLPCFSEREMLSHSMAESKYPESM